MMTTSSALFTSLLCAVLGWFEVKPAAPPLPRPVATAPMGGSVHPSTQPPVVIEVSVSTGTTSESVLLTVESAGCSRTDTHDSVRSLDIQLCRGPDAPDQAGFSLELHRGGEYLHMLGKAPLQTTAITVAEAHLGKDDVKVTLRRR